MQGEIMDIISRVLHAERDHARTIVEAIIDSEQSYLFTNNNDYRNNKSSVILKNDSAQENS